MFRPLNYAQKQQLTTRLFYAVAAGAVFTVAAPTLFPCPVTPMMVNESSQKQDKPEPLNRFLIPVSSKSKALTPKDNDKT
ncbi:hypothetical protein DSO57_1026023 [Entomophthora muscae]|nr:hypothetical protein DSO57_1026023 [Entomophthora muscae]